MQTRRLASTALLVLVSACLGACGGGGGGGGAAVTFDAARDLSRTGTTFLTGAGPFLDALSSTLKVGDNANTIPHRGHATFQVANIPQAATISQALLRLEQFAVEGSPYPSLGVLFVDHVDLGATLDGADHNVAPLTANLGTLSSTAVLEVKTLDVTAAVQADVAAGRPVSSFRLSFTQPTNGDGTQDLAYLGLGQQGVLTLTVTYTAP